MPWCDDCSKFWEPGQLKAKGGCPTCGKALPAMAATAVPGATATATTTTADQGGQGGAGPAPAPTAEPGPPGALPTADATGQLSPAGQAKGAPWHFKLLVVGVTVYMIYRIYWLIEWLPKHL